MTEQGTDRYGAEYKRTDNDFHARYLEQDNGVCSICHGTGAKIEIRYVVRNYKSARVKNKICKNLQAHEHSLWVCPKCINNFKQKLSVINERNLGKEKEKRMKRDLTQLNKVEQYLIDNDIPYERFDNEDEPISPQTPYCLDTIRRQDAIKEIARWIGYLDEDMILRIQTGLKRLPSAQTERKIGRWFVLDECANEGVYCSECHKKVFKIDCSNTMKWKNFKFCPYCGADMRGEEDE